MAHLQLFEVTIVSCVRRLESSEMLVWKGGKNNVRWGPGSPMKKALVGFNLGMLKLAPKRYSQHLLEDSSDLAS